MSGIAGIYFLDGRVVAPSGLASVMAPMMEAIAHRGHDGSRVWTEDCVGLGHQMLWTTPESLNERLPLESPTARLVLTSDARIDNRDELAAAFGIVGRSRETIADSELILRAYERWGEDCPEHLLGDFAFAIWSHARRTVFCARDHMGVKPFYYYKSDRVFLFASELKALLAFGETPRELNEVTVARYIALTEEDSSDTFYQNILRLRGGHSMVVSPDGIRRRRYWSLDPARELRLPSDRAYAEALRDVFTKAVQCRLRSAFPVGCELSGGLDSSSVVCTARRLLSTAGSGPLHTFSATFDEVPQADERRYVDAVLEREGSALIPHFIPCDRLNPLENLDSELEALAEPFWAPSMFMYSALYDTAADSAVRIVLSGEDGDNAIGYGVGWIARLLSTGRWMRAASEISGLAVHSESTRWQILKTHGLRPLSPRPVLCLWRRMKGPNPFEPDVLNAEFARRTGFVPREGSPRLDAIARRRAVLDQWRNLTDGLTASGCEQFGIAAARRSVEIRYPFLDRRVLEFCLAVPASQKLHRGWIRMIMRRAMEGILPEAVRWRAGKAQLSPNLNRSLLLFAKDRLDDVIIRNPRALGGYMDLPNLRANYRQYVADSRRTSYKSIWSAVTLGTWLPAFENVKS